MSTAALPVHVALVDDTGQIPAQQLAQAAGALSQQVAADFAPVWKVNATVGAYPQAPAGVWAIHVQAQLDQPGALGYHTSENNQPVSLVEFTPDWTITVSHELLEMLADPWGNRMHPAELPAGLEAHHQDFGLPSPTSRVSYLLEVADPCEARSYPLGGVSVSDFLLPGWYRTMPARHPAYSHAGGCAQPRQVADGGYVSFATPDGSWWQTFNQGGHLDVQSLGKFSRADFGSLREFADHHARARRAA